MLKIQIEKNLYERVKKTYSSWEYIIKETFPMISIRKLTSLPVYCIDTKETIEIELSEELIEDIGEYTEAGWDINELVNYIIGLGYILEV